jgi:dTDP-N-acetylfucosamine:lipid II N-acetylfucosaminyltransferase
MILHLLADDKFSDYVINQFDDVDFVNNKYVILTTIELENIKYLKRKDRCEIISEGSQDFLLLCENLINFKAIIFHNISTSAHASILKKTPNTVNVAWVFWGFELYGRKSVAIKYLGKNTQKIYLKYILKQYLKKAWSLITKGKRFEIFYEVPIYQFRRIDYCLTDIYEDFVFAKKTIKTNFKHLWYNYYSIKETLGHLKDSYINSNNILLGNSASISNNHLEMFRILRQFDLSDRKVIVPLSYGDKHFTNVLIKKGKKKLGISFHPLEHFIDLAAYNEILTTCSITIMNHYRHQAMGNIITALWLGSKVYLNKRSTTYSYLKRLGIHIYSVDDDLTPKNSFALNPLDDEKVNQNRSILTKEYGEESMRESIRGIISILND